IRAGEASGELGYALRQLVEYMDWQESITSQLRQATMYPIVVVVAVTLLVVGLIGFVFPRILPLLKGQTELPWPTRVILFASTVVRTKWLTVLLTFNAIVFLCYFAYRTDRGRLIIDRLIL